MKNGNQQDLIAHLQNHNIITHKDVALAHAEKIVPLCHTFIEELSLLMSPEDYPAMPSEFIEMVIAGMTYTSASLLVELFNLFGNVPMITLHRNFKKSLDAAINLQLRDNLRY